MTTHQGDHHQCQEQHHDVQTDGQQLIRTRHLRRAVADEQQVLKLVGILLHKQIDAKHKNIETQQRDDQANSHNNGNHQAKEEGCLLSVQTIVLSLEAVVLHVLRDVLFSQVGSSDHQSRRGSIGIGRKALIGHLHKRLRNKNGIQTSREADNLAFVLCFLPIAVNAKVEGDERDESFAHLWQRTVLRKTEVIHSDIATRKDDGHKCGVFAKRPFLLGNIDKLIRNALDGEFGIQHLLAVDAHRGVDLKLSSRELPHPVDERLCGKVFNLSWCER